MSHDSLHTVILGILAQASPQAPMADTDIIGTLASQASTAAIILALNAMVEDRLISCAEITKSGLTRRVYWPTGLTRPALTGIKPKEPIAVPHHQPQDTQAQKLIKLIIAHGPIINADLAERSGIKANNIDGLLKAAVKSGQITTRIGYVAEQGRELRQWMTATQAAEWDEAGIEQFKKMTTDPAQSGHAMSHPDAEPDRKDGDDILINILSEIRAAIGDTGQIMLGDLAQAIKTRIHDLKNEVAARDMILNNLAGTLKVQHIADIPAALDDLTHALSTRAMTAQAPAGKPALLLIDSADLTEVEMLGDDDDAQAMAMTNIELGHAARVMVVRIVGEATRRVEWKEAA